MGSDNQMVSPSAICIVSEPHAAFKNRAPSLASITRVGRCIMRATSVLPKCNVSESGQWRVPSGQQRRFLLTTDHRPLATTLMIQANTPHKPRLLVLDEDRIILQS